MRKKARDKAILEALREPAPLSTDRGSYLRGARNPKPNKKTRRHSGRYTPKRAGTLPQSEMIENAEEPQEEYDDWIEYRDGLRFDPDSTHLRSEFMFGGDEIKEENKKIIKEINIRKAKLNKKKLKEKKYKYDRKKNRMAQRMYKMWKKLHSNRKV